MGGILKKRQDMDPAFMWNLKDLYEDVNAWEEELRIFTEKTGKIEAYRGRLGQSAAALLEALLLKDELGKLAERIYVYANQTLHQDTSDSAAQALAGKAQTAMVGMYAQMAFMTPELLEIPEEQLAQFYEEEPDLSIYRHFFEELFREKEHTLSPKEEELLAKTSEMAQGASDIFSMFNNADITFPTIYDEEGQPLEVTHGNYIRLMENPDRNIRENAFCSVYHTYEKYKNMLAATFKANVVQETFYASVRGYESSLHAALFGNSIPVEVYDNLIEAVHENLPKLHRYMGIRKKALDLDELHMYDIYVPMVSGSDRKISYEEAKEMVLEGLKPMGEEYLSLLKEGFDGGWIDVYENKGKRSGAYSWGAYGTHPYVLLNYQENLNNVFTIAHEMGHSLHSWYSDHNQPYVYAGYRIFVAEVASTCNEALLIHHLLETAKDKKEKAFLINYFLEQFRTTLYRQTMFAEFEKITHSMQEAGDSLTADVLCEIYKELNRKYFGEEVVIDHEIAMEWARIPHFYTPFYVYQYATGFSAAIALSGKILKEGPSAVDDYKNFLKGGCSTDPISLLKLAGVDMASSKPVKDALEIFGQYLDQLEECL